jgi:hypothetical protein
MALTTSRVGALCLGQVNREVGRFGEEQAHESIGKDGGSFANGSIERRVAIAQALNQRPKARELLA